MSPITVIGPTGSGKTTRFALPVLTEWPGPAVVLSVKADLLSLAYQARQTRGPVHVLDPENALGGRYPTARFDLARWASTLAQAQDLASVLIGSGRVAGLQDGQFWYQLAQTWTAPLLFAGAHAGLPFDEIIDLVLQDPSPRAELLVAETGDLIAQRMFRSIAALDARARASVLATVTQALRVFNRSGALAAVTGHDFDVDGLITSTGTLAMTLPGFRMAEIAPLFSAVLTRIWTGLELRAARGGGGPPVLLLIDEAAQVPAVTDHLLEWSTTSRGLGVQLVTVWQDDAQLTSRFGVERATVLNNSGATLYLDEEQGHHLIRRGREDLIDLPGPHV